MFKYQSIFVVSLMGHMAGGIYKKSPTLDCVSLFNPSSDMSFGKRDLDNYESTYRKQGYLKNGIKQQRGKKPVFLFFSGRGNTR